MVPSYITLHCTPLDEAVFLESWGHTAEVMKWTAWTSVCTGNRVTMPSLIPVSEKSFSAQHKHATHSKVIMVESGIKNTYFFKWYNFFKCVRT